jgi:peroxiredoxin
VAAVDVTGRWEVVFTEDNGNKIPAVAELDQRESRVLGTFLTPTGDYRYLEGEVDGRQLKLSTFDGAHAFVFTATMDSNGKLTGDMWSGTRSHESWVAHKNFDAKLPDPYSLTFLKEGYDSLEFSFPDLDGRPVSLADDQYQGKVVLVTLSGTWCPNCADEVAFLTQYYRRNHDRGVEIITLLYEHFDDFERAAAQGKALRNQYGIDYELLVAGVSDKVQAAETLPMLKSVVAFPTMIFIDRSGRVRRIHTGFSGPGTGAYYTAFLADFERFMDELLAENA